VDHSEHFQVIHYAPGQVCPGRQAY
jgi:hypothetical protein